MSSSKRKTIVYVDGFNLFHALKEMKWKKYYWLDLNAFCLKLMSPMQSLTLVRYFTSRAIGDAQEQKRQNSYIEALETLKCVDIQYGKFTSDDWGCHVCGRIEKIHHEKQTDVNIAVSLLTDAQEDRFDDAILITADSDQMRTVQYISNTYAEKRIIVAFPPGRHTADLEPPTASKNVHLNQKQFENSQFPNEVISKSGFKLIRPHSWV